MLLIERHVSAETCRSINNIITDNKLLCFLLPYTAPTGRTKTEWETSASCLHWWCLVGENALHRR